MKKRSRAFLTKKTKKTKKVTLKLGREIMSDRWNLRGKSVLVTGGTKGIGFACVKEFLSLNAKKVLICARTKASVEDAISTLNDKRVSGCVCDVSSCDFVCVPSCIVFSQLIIICFLSFLFLFRFLSKHMTTCTVCYDF